MNVNKSIGVSDYQNGQRDLNDQNRQLMRSSSLEQHPEINCSKKFEPSEETNYLKQSMLR